MKAAVGLCALVALAFAASAQAPPASDPGAAKLDSDYAAWKARSTQATNATPDKPAPAQPQVTPLASSTDSIPLRYFGSAAAKSSTPNQPTATTIGNHRIGESFGAWLAINSGV